MQRLLNFHYFELVLNPVASPHHQHGLTETQLVS